MIRIQKFIPSLISIQLLAGTCQRPIVTVVSDERIGKISWITWPICCGSFQRRTQVMLNNHNENASYDFYPRSSSLSTGLNSMAAVVLEDFIKPYRKTPFGTRTADIILKLTVITLGILCVILVFVVEKTGSHVLQVYNTHRVLKTFQRILNVSVINDVILDHERSFPWDFHHGLTTTLGQF